MSNINVQTPYGRSKTPYVNITAVRPDVNYLCSIGRHNEISAIQKLLDINVQTYGVKLHT